MKARVWSETQFAEKWIDKKYLGKWVDVECIISIGNRTHSPSKARSGIFVWLRTEIGEWCYFNNFPSGLKRYTCVFDEIDDELKTEIYLRLLT